MNIILIGMPGSGKSTVGVVLARMLGFHFCDTDLVLQQHCGKKLQEILRTEGDAAFFRHEEEVLAALEAENTVIATGGSAVYSDRAMRHLKEGGTCVYLQVATSEIERRLADFSERGVAIADGMTIADLFAVRKPLYECYADITVCAEGGTVWDTARRIAEALRAE